MSMKTLTITFFLTMIFSTVASAVSVVLSPNGRNVVMQAQDMHKHSSKLDYPSPLDKEWNQVCQRDVSCK